MQITFQASRQRPLGLADKQDATPPPHQNHVKSLIRSNHEHMGIWKQKRGSTVFIFVFSHLHFNAIKNYALRFFINIASFF